MCIYGFMQRNNLSCRKVTHQAQANNSVQENVDDFVQYLQMQMMILGVLLCNIWNADKTKYCFCTGYKVDNCRKGK